MSNKHTKKAEDIEERNETKETENNEEINISTDVVGTIAGLAVLKVDGVSSMAGGLAGEISEVFGGKKNFAKGIKIDINGKKVKMDINVIVDYGMRIPDIAFEIQTKVKKAIESMTGLTAEEINVHIQGINTDSKVNSKK